MKKPPQKKMSKKEIEKMPLHNDADVKRYIGFVTESHREEFKVLSENIQGLDERMERGFKKVNEKLDEHTDILNRHELVLYKHSEMLSAHTDMIGRLLIDSEEIKSGMKQKIDREEFTKLEKRMVALESYVFTGKARGITKR